MRKIKTLEDEINDFMELWGADEMISFIEDTAEIIQIYNISDEEEIKDDHKIGVRVVRTVYHLSYLAEKYATIMVRIRAKHPGLYKKIEDIAQLELLYTEQDCS